MRTLGNIYLVWRKGRGSRRVAVGVIKRNSTKGVRFNYLQEGVEKVVQDGFTTYIDFPDIQKEYTENVIDIFGQRLNKPERADIQKYYDFWEIEPRYQADKYYLLAHTQGLLSTDNFEFLADYSPVKSLRFVSEICGLSINKLQSNFSILEGDELEWRRDNKNQYDQKAVTVFKDGRSLGNIKLIHCNVFSKTGGEKLKIKVKSVDKNGHINRIFVTVYMPE